MKEEIHHGYKIETSILLRHLLSQLMYLFNEIPIKIAIEFLLKIIGKFEGIGIPFQKVRENLWKEKKS